MKITTLKQARTIHMKMTNLPNAPWHIYYKLKRYGNSVLWSSAPKKTLQYNQENFWLTDDELDGMFRDGHIFIKK